MAEPPDNWITKHSKDSSPLTGEGIVLDIGTGDGRFVSEAARLNPTRFYIGIDANLSALKKISQRVLRKPGKGGLPNVLFLQAAVEDLPQELNHVADEIHIHFPWGSLLRGVALGQKLILENLRRIAAEGAQLEVIIGFDKKRDAGELSRLNITDFSVAYVNANLRACYQSAGFEITEIGDQPPAHWQNLQTSWARRLKISRSRSLVYFIAEAI